MTAGLQQLASTLRLQLRNRMGMIYGYIFPTIFLVSFWVLYRYEPVPLIRHLQGDPDAGSPQDEPAILGADLAANDGRKDYLRARLSRDAEGRPVATPASRQDSSMLRVLADSNCLVIREPHAPAAMAGDVCRVMRVG